MAPLAPKIQFSKIKGQPKKGSFFTRRRKKHECLCPSFTICNSWKAKEISYLTCIANGYYSSHGYLVGTFKNHVHLGCGKNKVLHQIFD